MFLLTTHRLALDALLHTGPPPAIPHWAVLLLAVPGFLGAAWAVVTGLDRLHGRVRDSSD